MPQFLIEAEKQDCVDYCLAILTKFDEGRTNRVDDMITGDENCYDLEMKRHKKSFDCKE